MIILSNEIFRLFVKLNDFILIDSESIFFFLIFLNTSVSFDKAPSSREFDLKDLRAKAKMRMKEVIGPHQRDRGIGAY